MQRIFILGVLGLHCMMPRTAEAGAPAADARGKEAGFQAPAGRVTMSALGGFGFGDGARLGDDAYLGVGYGVRAGYTFPGTPVYLGGTLLKYEGPWDGVYDVDTLTVDFEVGYDIAAGPVVARPYLGLGALTAVFGSTEESEKGSDGGSGITPRVAPGLLAWCPIGLMTAGVDARYELTPNWNDRALSLMGSVGMTF